MIHYVCQGDCKAVSDKEGVCEAEFCNRKGEELKICGCEDGSHPQDQNQEGGLS